MGEVYGTGKPPPVSSSRSTPRAAPGLRQYHLPSSDGVSATLILHLVLIVLGVAVLYFGGEILVRSVSGLASALDVSSFLIAFTVVAFGTSAPELAASAAAAIDDSPELALGNVVGSNIANIALILGLIAVISPLELHSVYLAREVPFMIATAIATLAFVATGELARWQALVLFAGLLSFLWFMVRTSGGADIEDTPHEPPPMWKSVLGSLVGLVLLTAGAKLMVDSAQELARGFGVSESIIGLTLVAFGTSVPELASCLVAAARQQGTIVLGNVIGSNVFNTLLILPVAILLKPFSVSFHDWAPHLGVMLGVSVLLAVFFLTRRLGRVGGVLLLGIYFGYIAWIAISAA